MKIVYMVIKVKYEDMLRRFRVMIIDDEQIELTIYELKEKILSLFGFALGNTDLILTYIDEDGDVVNLVDDDDLREVVKQGLDPLRINVKKLVCSNSTALPADLKSGFSGILKAVSEPVQPLCKKFATLSNDYFPRVDLSFLDNFCVPEITCQPVLHDYNQDSIVREEDWSRGSEIESRLSKLDSCLIDDVMSAADNGTIIMAPSTPFVKIWRMRNNGIVQWPHKTQLIWIGGDRMSDQSCVDVEIPAVGLAVDSELDIAADLISPEIPGDYVSYWRLVSPSGEKFGQNIKVVIEVEEAPPIIIKQLTTLDSSISQLAPISTTHDLEHEHEEDEEVYEMGLDDKFMHNLVPTTKKKKNINKNKLLRKKNNRWKS